MTGMVEGLDLDGGSPTLMQRALVARAEAAVLLGDVRADLAGWSNVLEEVERALQSNDLRSLDEHAGMVAARDRLFNVLAELSALADPYSVWTAAADGDVPSGSE